MKQSAFSSSSARVAAAIAAGALAAGIGLHAAPARACGGFFCSQVPVEQAAEEIIFVDNPDGTVTAAIRIQYSGPAERFAWVLPIKGAPQDVGVSSNVAFDNLRRATDPRYVLNTTVEGECKVDDRFGNDPQAEPGSFADAGVGVADEDSISVVARGSVGPYDWHVIMVNPALTDPAQAAVDWLGQNEYDVTSIGSDVLRPYLADGLNLMAFKLTKGADANTGSIRPVVLTYESEVPAIPIRPTAVAAQSDMGILVWVLGASQAIPLNYKSLVLNEARINWFNYQSNYRALVTEAADEAGGQGFVTEMAGAGSQLALTAWTGSDVEQWRQYSTTTFVDGFDAIQQAAWQYRGWDGWRDAVCDSVTLPVDVTCDDFGRSPDEYSGLVEIDTELFIRNLYEGVVRPVIRTQELISSRPYFTRLFSTMSADEMTVDPAFDFNSDLADVSNVHNADHVIECSGSVTYFEAPWRIELPQGGVIRGKGQSAWPIAAGDLPANLKIVQLGTSGDGQVVEDNSEAVRDLLAALARPRTGTTTPVQPPRGVPTGTAGSTASGGRGAEEPPPGSGSETPGATSGTDSPATNSGGDGLCSVGPVGADAPSSSALALIGVALLLFRGRRRSSEH